MCTLGPFSPSHIYYLSLLLTLLARLYDQPAAAHVYAETKVETNDKIGALARVYTGAYGGIGETLLHSRLYHCIY